MTGKKPWGERTLYDDGKVISEYRYIMQKHLDRKLRKDEVVHHINCNHYDNRLGNLQVMTKEKHAKLHSMIKSLSNPVEMYYELKKIIYESSFTRKEIALKMNIKIYCLNAKLNGYTKFTDIDIENLVKIFKIKSSDIGKIFFKK